MERMNSRQITVKTAEKKIRFFGWVSESRDFGGLRFLSLRDRFGFLQVTAHKKKVKQELFEKVPEFTKESLLCVEGKIEKSPKAPAGVELIPDKIELVSNAHTPTPIDMSGKIETDQSARLDWRSIDLRKPKNQALFTVQAKLLQGAQEWLNENSYQQVFTPCLMGAASESGAEVFRMKYFDTEAFLRQDPQLHRQLAIAGGIEKLYDIGPSWRAEQSHTTKHLCEHRAIAVEEAFIEDETTTERAQEELVVAMLKKVKKECKEELKLLEVGFKIPETPFPELRFPKVYDIIEEKGGSVERGKDPDAEGEKIIWDYIQKKFKADFYFFNRFPFEAKPFYVMRVDEEPEYARSVDLYFRGLELSSGGQREHRHERIVEQVKLKGMALDSVEWFTKFFKYGVPPHGGFAIGIERITQQLLNVENIRDTALFPRDPTRVLP